MSNFLPWTRNLASGALLAGCGGGGGTTTDSANGDQKWFYVVDPGREHETSIEQQGIKPLIVEAEGFLFTFDEDAEIDEIRSRTEAFLKSDRIRLASVYFTEQPSGDNSRLRYHSQIGLMGVSSVPVGT